MPKKSIFDPAVKAEVFKRLDNLQPDTQPLWGTMKPNEMLKHLSEALKIATGEIQVPDRSNLFTRTLIRYFVQNAMVPSKETATKRPVATFPEIDVVKKGITVGDFLAEKENYKKELARVEAISTYVPKSPLIGKMSREDWARNFYGHAHYHLTQFGV